MAHGPAPTVPTDVHHPRPQLTRPGWVDLSGPWGFAFDDDVAGMNEEWHVGEPRFFGRTIVVPFPFESPASGIGDTGFHPVVWYRRTFTAPVPHGRRLLHLGAVDYRAHVGVNGRQVAYHEAVIRRSRRTSRRRCGPTASRSSSGAPRTAPP